MKIIMVVDKKMASVTKRYKFTNWKYKTVNSIRGVLGLEHCISAGEIYTIVLDHSMIVNYYDQLYITHLSRNVNVDIIGLVDSNDDIDNFIEMGIVDHMTKPISLKLLTGKIERYDQNIKRIVALESAMSTLLVDNSVVLSTLARSRSEMATVLSEIVELNNMSTDFHGVRIAANFKEFALALMGCDNMYKREVALWDLDNHMVAIQLHDIGNIGIPDNILLKKERLTDDELLILKNHVQIGVDMMERVINHIGESDNLTLTIKYISSHHERWDGSGYPYGLSGVSIPLEGRVLSIIDAYDALTTPRSYKTPLSREDAISIINESAGTHFDPELIDVFNMIIHKLK